jgi:formate-dependent nitrite reductase membrane component NrfD
MLRDVAIGWGWEVYIEMFLAGLAVGAFLIAMLLELFGRGRSPIARSGHIVTLPLVLIATGLLIYKLERQERFWHMVIQSENIPTPMFKWWAPISLGTWGLMIFSAFAAVSFIDAIIDRGWLRLGPWYRRRTLHGSLLGKLHALAAIPVALFVGAYSGALLSVTAVRGWVDTFMIAPLFVAISGATGAALLLLIEAIRTRAPLGEVEGLARASFFMTLWQLVALIVFAISLGGALTYFLSSTSTIVAAIVGTLLCLVAALLLLVPGVLRFDTPRYVSYGISAALILVSGFLLRYVVVMGPQHAIS